MHHTYPKTNQSRPVSFEHSVTVEIDENQNVSLRQINNQVSFDKARLDNILEVARSNGSNFFNIPPRSLRRLRKQEISKDDIVIEPIRVILFSSYGLLEQGEWTSSRPSDGIWVQAELLARNAPEAAPLCIDPNIFEEDELKSVVKRFSTNDKRTVLGFSVLPEIFHNDTRLILRIHEIRPDAVKVVGGIASDSLRHLPTKNGKWGIEHALPIDLIISGQAVSELGMLTRFLYRDNNPGKTEIKRFAAEFFPNFNGPEDSKYVSRQVTRAKEIVRKQFIPQSHKDVVHPHSYVELNTGVMVGHALGSVDILSDNTCHQNCYYCGSPRYAVFPNREEELQYILRVGRNQPILSFSNNDLSDCPEKTIWLCEQMVKAGMLQPKHGKMRLARYDPDLIEAMATAKFRRIAVGIESFDPGVRAGLAKYNFKDEDIRLALGHMIKVGIVPEINLIFFSPHETLESLKTTIQEALYWHGKGASLFVTCGLYAIPNCPGISKLLTERSLDTLRENVHIQEICLPGMHDTLLFPRRWKTRPELEKLRKQILSERDSIISHLSNKHHKKMSISIQDYITVALLANYFGLEKHKTREYLMKDIDQCTEQMISKEYINI